MANSSPKGFVCDFDDFTGDTINTDKYVATISTGGTFAITAQQVNGTVQGTTDATDEDAGLLCTGLIYKPSNGSLRLEVRAKISVITTARMFVGFSDATTEADLLPMTIAATTWTTTASTAAGLCYSSAATTANWTAMCVDADSDLTTPALADRILTGCAPVADTYQTFVIELQDQGSGKSPIGIFSVIDDNGKIYTKRFETNLTRTTLLCGAVGFQNEGAVAHTMTIDYIEVENSRV
jgi:hypothetical protein